MKYLDWLFNDNKIVQLTHQTTSDKNSRWVHGWFNNADDLRAASTVLKHKGNLFVSLNRPYARDVTNRVDSNTGFKNEDIERYTRIFIDLDPERDGYIASTDFELELALERRRYAQQFFRALGWPRPAHANSGNGAHLIFRTVLPNTAEFNQMMAVIFNGLKAELSSDLVSLDTKVKNPGRIHPLYGTFKRKGIESPERPHRQTQIFAPQQWQQVRPQQIEHLAEHYAVKTPEFLPRQKLTHIGGKGDYKTLDIVGLFQSHGLYLQPTPEPGKHWVTCPYKHLHSGTGVKGTVIWETSTSGKPHLQLQP